MKCKENGECLSSTIYRGQNQSPLKTLSRKGSMLVGIICNQKHPTTMSLTKETNLNSLLGFAVVLKIELNVFSYLLVTIIDDL